MANNTYTLKDVAKMSVFMIGDIAPELETVEQEPNDPAVGLLVQCVNDVLRELNRHRGLRLQNARHTFNTVDDYTTGTVAITQGGTTVTGTSTVWTAAMVGRAFSTNRHDSIYRIASFTSATSIEIDRVWVDDDVTADTYRIAQDLYEAPSNLRTITAAYLSGTRGWPLDIRDPVWIDDGRYEGRHKVVETGAPQAISLDPDRSSSRNYQFELDPFPDEIYQVNLIVNLVLTNLKHDIDLIPLEDEAIDVLLDGVVAKWKSRRPKDKGDRLVWEEYLATVANRYLAAGSKATDKAVYVVPDDVMRSVPNYNLGGRPDWKNR